MVAKKYYGRRMKSLLARRSLFPNSPNAAPGEKFCQFGTQVEVWHPRKADDGVWPGVLEVVHRGEDELGITPAATAFERFCRQSRVGAFLKSLGISTVTEEFPSRRERRRGSPTATQVIFPAPEQVAETLSRLDATLPRASSLLPVETMDPQFVRGEPTVHDVYAFLSQNGRLLLPGRGIYAARAMLSELPGIVGMPPAVQAAWRDRARGNLNSWSSGRLRDGWLAARITPFSLSPVCGALSPRGIPSAVLSGDEAGLAGHLRTLLDVDESWQPPATMGLAAHREHAQKVQAAHIAMSRQEVYLAG